MIEAIAPSNIALIKYMGKEAANIPTNSSLSYSLNHLLTKVRIEASTEGDQDQWQALESKYPLKLSTKSIERYLGFFQQLKDLWGISGTYKISSANSFPSDCGLASSASSFAALSLASYQLACEQRAQRFLDQGFTGQLELDRRFLSSYSRMGSGSSCRSLYSEWSLWENDSAVAIDLPYKNLHHIAVIVDEGKKEVSSSEAHQRVKSSLLMDGRTRRANLRLDQLLSFLRESRWQEAYQICWQEFWDMHALFETSYPSFGYMTDHSLGVLQSLKAHWSAEGDGPLITMDAGANIHLLFREDQKDLFTKMKSKYQENYKLWASDDGGNEGSF